MDSIGDIHKKKKNQKEKTKGLKPIAYRTIGKYGKSDDLSTGTLKKDENQQIDLLIEELKRLNVYQAPYHAWYATACHKLGVADVRSIARHAYEHGNNPKHLFSYKLKRRLSLLNK